MSIEGYDAQRVRIPADVEMADHLLGPLTFRQLAILAAAGLLGWTGFTLLSGLMPWPVLAVFGVLIAATGAGLALGRLDGVSLDRLAVAAIAQARAPRRLVPAPHGVAPPPGFVDGPRLELPAPLRLPAQEIDTEGVIDLGTEGFAAVLAVSTVCFALRTADEREALVAAYGRWLNSLSGPTQILVRAQRVDLVPRIAALRRAAPGLPHPALEHAARAHAAFLDDLAARRDLLTHEVLLVLREPAGPPARRLRAGDAASRLARRAEDAARALRPAGVSARLLTGSDALATLAACVDPTAPSAETYSGRRAAPDDVITTRPASGPPGGPPGS